MEFLSLTLINIFKLLVLYQGLPISNTQIFFSKQNLASNAEITDQKKKKD